METFLSEKKYFLGKDLSKRVLVQATNNSRGMATVKLSFGQAKLILVFIESIIEYIFFLDPRKKQVILFWRISFS
jgi:hypothetical protein